MAVDNRHRCRETIECPLPPEGSVTYTTPTRPVGVATALPALAPFARTATRLDPRPGNPLPQDSSVGGPLL